MRSDVSYWPAICGHARRRTQDRRADPARARDESPRSATWAARAGRVPGATGRGRAPQPVPGAREDLRARLLELLPQRELQLFRIGDAAQPRELRGQLQILRDEALIFAIEEETDLAKRVDIALVRELHHRRRAFDHRARSDASEKCVIAGGESATRPTSVLPSRKRSSSLIVSAIGGSASSRQRRREPPALQPLRVHA